MAESLAAITEIRQALVAANGYLTAYDISVNQGLISDRIVAALAACDRLEANHAALIRALADLLDTWDSSTDSLGREWMALGNRVEAVRRAAGLVTEPLPTAVLSARTGGEDA